MKKPVDDFELYCPICHYQPVVAAQHWAIEAGDELSALSQPSSDVAVGELQRFPKQDNPCGIELADLCPRD